MEIVISILIASVISLGISIYFHEISKKNNAMERVKKYADSRKQDMEDSYKTLENHFNMLIAEFDARQNEANAAVKLLTQQNKDFEEKITSLDKSIKAVQNIEAQINNYSKILDELNEMSGNVEENLLRIQKESVIVTKLNDRLDKQQQTVDNIEKKIPQVTQKFSEENAEQLKTVGTTLLDEYKNYADKIAAEIRQSQNDAENALAKIKQQIQEAYNEASAKAETLENTAFEHLSQQATERSQKYISEIKTQNAQLDAQITKSFKESETKLVNDIKADLTKMNENFQKSIENLSNNYNGKVQALHEKYNSQLDSVAGKNDGIIAKLETQFNEDFTRIDQKCKSDFEKISQRYEENYSTLTQKYDKDYQTLSAQYDDVVNKMSQKYDDTIGKISQKYDSQIGSLTARGDKELTDYEAKISADIQKMKTDYTKAFESATTINNTKINEFNQNFVAEQQRLKSEFDLAISQMTDESTGKIEGLQNSINQEISSFANESTEKIEGFQNSINQEIASFTNENSGKIEGIRNGINQEIASFADESTGKLESLQNSISQEIASFADECKEQINNLQNEYNTSLSDFKSDIGTRLSVVENEYENKTTALENNIRDITERYETEEEGLQNVFTERLRALNEDYKQKIAEIRLSLDESLKQCNETTEFLKRDVDGNSKSLESIQTELDGEIKVMQERYAGLYHDALASADQKEKEALDTFNQGAKQKIDEYAELIQQKIDSLQETITERIKAISLESSTSIHNAETAVADLQKECTAANQKAQTLQPELDERIKLINKEFEDFKAEAENKLNSMNKQISDAVKRSVAESEQTHLSILEGIDEQLHSYKKDIESKLSQIQNSGSDVDTLEKSLRGAMLEVQNRVLGDFDKFTSEQQRKHEEFSTQIKEDSQTIEVRLQEIDKSLEELKNTATGNMSAKLIDFEKAFNNNILTKNNEIDSQLSGWKVELDTKLSEIAGSYESQRKDVEQNYLIEVKTNLASISSKANEQYDTLADAIEKSKLGMETNISEIQETFTDFQEETRTKISQISNSTDKEFKTEIERALTLAQSNLKKTQEDLIKDLQDFEAGIRERQETSTSSIDAALAEFNTWKQQLRSQLDGANTVFQEELSAFKTASSNDLEETQQKITEDMKKYAAYIQEQQNDLSEKISSLQNQTEDSIKEYEERSKQIVDQLGKTYTKMLEDTEARVKAQNEDSAQNLAQLKKDIQTASEQNRANQAQFVLKMQNDANELQVRMGDLTKELQSIQSSIGVYERAEAMKRHLDEGLDELNNRMEQLDGFTDTAEDITKQYNAIVRMNEEMERELGNIEQQKQRVTSLEQKFGQLFALSNTIDERIQALNTTTDDIGTMEVAVRDYTDKLDIVSQQYERLAKKDEVINRVLKDVDTSFANLKDIEQRIADCQRQVTSLPNEIKDVQANVDRLLKSGPKITEATSKLQNLDNIITEAETRIDNITATNSGIKEAQLKLAQFSKDVDNKFETLHQITKNEVSKTTAARDKGITPQTKEAIKQLKREGWTIPELAKRFNRTTTEIELLLELPD